MTKEELFKKCCSYKNGFLSKEKNFLKYFPEEYESVISYCKFPDDFIFSQKLYHYLNNDSRLSIGLCKCGKRCKFISLAQGYREYCGLKCSNNSKSVKYKKINTCSSNYGVTHPLKSLEVKEKMKNTCIDRYGVENVSQSEIIKEKKKNTYFEKYGVDSIFKSDMIKEKIKNTNLEKYHTENPMQSKDLQNKVKETCLKKYGVEHPMQSDEIKEKLKETNLERYGVENVFSSDEIKEKIRKTNLERYGADNVFKSDTIKEKIKNTNMEKYGIEWYCMTKECRAKSSNDSKPNLEFAKLLDENSIMYEREFTLENYSFDFKVENHLIEINPTITHNSYMSVFDREPIDKNYHLHKLICAEERGYSCMHIWDWDDKSKIINMLKPKETLYARKLELKEVPEKECNEFLNLYHLQNTCKGQKIRYGLYKDNLLVQVMTFGKPRYNKKYELELLRLCSHKDYKIVGGAEKIFKYILDKFKPKNIISYCDNSKFDGGVYERLGFVVNKKPSPSKHWYNIKTGQHVTDNLLRQRGFDQLFNANYGKGTSNEELMIQYGFLPVYDCGQMVFINNIIE